MVLYSKDNEKKTNTFASRPNLITIHKKWEGCLLKLNEVMANLDEDWDDKIILKNSFKTNFYKDQNSNI